MGFPLFLYIKIVGSIYTPSENREAKTVSKCAVGSIVQLFENLCIFLWCKQEGKPHKYGQEENKRDSTRCGEIYL